jgi:plasmid stabilization system protein ParE
MTYRVVIQPMAERDIRATAAWKQARSRSPSEALRWIRAIRKKIESLASNPQRFPVDFDSQVFGSEK